MSRFLASVLTFVALLVGPSSPAAACSCDGTFGELVERIGSGRGDFEPALIFSGIAAEISEPDEHGQIDVVFDVQQAWTDGPVPLQVKIEGDSSSCGIGVPEGLTYFLASELPSGGLWSGSCTTSSAYGATILFERALGPGRVPEPAEPSAATGSPSTPQDEGDNRNTLRWLLVPAVAVAGAGLFVWRWPDRTNR